ncbi:MAG: enoyl-CoA hydratase-related protein [Maricaulaceae bacterium]
MTEPTVDTVLVDFEPPLATLTLNKPDRLNVLGEPGDGAAIEAAFDRIRAREDIRCVILTGAGRAFSAGGDVKAMRDKTGLFAGDPTEIRDAYRHDVHKVVRAVHRCDKPVIAAVNGPAIGLGCDVAGFADIRIASETARFGVTFLTLGLAPGDGGGWLLPRLIGTGRAAELLFTGEIINAETALNWGWVSRVVPADDLAQTARTLGLKIAERPSFALAATKTLLREGQTLGLDALLELTAALQALAHGHSDHARALEAFFAGRASR